MAIRRLLTGIALAAVSASTVLFNASPAHATPSDCSWARYTSTSIVGTCRKGTGRFVVRITCKHRINALTFYYTYGYSSTKNIGEVGYAYCPGAGETFHNGGFVLY